MESRNFMSNECEVEVINRQYSAYGVEQYNKLDFMAKGNGQTINPQDLDTPFQPEGTDVAAANFRYSLYVPDEEPEPYSAALVNRERVFQQLPRDNDDHVKNLISVDIYQDQKQPQPKAQQQANNQIYYHQYNPQQPQLQFYQQNAQAYQNQPVLGQANAIQGYTYQQQQPAYNYQQQQQYQQPQQVQAPVVGMISHPQQDQKDQGLLFESRQTSHKSNQDNDYRNSQIINSIGTANAERKVSKKRQIDVATGQEKACCVIF